MMRKYIDNNTTICQYIVTMDSYLGSCYFIKLKPFANFSETLVKLQTDFQTTDNL